MKRFAPLMLGLATMGLAAMACTPTPPAEEAAVPAEKSVAETLGLMVGALEEHTSPTEGQPSAFKVRVLFANDGTGWKSLDPKCSDMPCLQQAPSQFPVEVNWTLAQAGAARGNVTGIVEVEWPLYADVGTQYLSEETPAPKVGEPSLDFAGDDGKPVQRPLIAVSAPNFADPEGWTPADLTPEALAAARAEFRAHFAVVQNCTSPEENTPRPITYTEQDVGMFAGWTSAKGWSLISAVLDGYKCDGPMSDTAYSPQTYAISPEGKAIHLGEGLDLLDAGDYDKDGKSELVFHVSRYNQGGYELRYNDFTGHAPFVYSFH